MKIRDHAALLAVKYMAYEEGGIAAVTVGREVWVI